MGRSGSNGRSDRRHHRRRSWSVDRDQYRSGRDRARDLDRRRRNDSRRESSRERDRKRRREERTSSERSSGRGHWKSMFSISSSSTRSAPPPSQTRHSQGRHHTSVVSLPRPPPHFYCHICGNNHWTIDCSRLKANPDKFPLMDLKRGCWKCGRRAHTAAKCTLKAYRCGECGAMHYTKTCAYDHESEEWHEFFDAGRNALFYTNADETVKSWNPIIHELDTIVWYCPRCSVMIPHKYHECLKCHSARPKPIESSSSSDNEDEVSSNDSVFSSSSSSSSSPDGEVLRAER